jgi:hypothetical protein
MHSVEPGPVLAAERIIESAVELTRAEAGLALARARVLAVKMMGVLAAVLFAAAAAQGALIVIALSPVLFKSDGWSTVLFALVLPVSLTALAVRVALRAWRELSNIPDHSAAQGAA